MWVVRRQRVNISFDIPILNLAMWQHFVLCVLSFARRALDTVSFNIGISNEILIKMILARNYRLPDDG